MADSVDVALEEYKSLREECLTALRMQHAILRYGIGGLLLMFASAISSINFDKQLAGIILVFLLPGAAYMVVFIWFGEFQRMIRAGNFVMTIEDKMEQFFSGRVDSILPVLSWENYLRKLSFGSTIQMKFNYLVTSGFFVALAIASCAFGLYFCGVEFEESVVTASIAGNILVGAFTIGWLGFFGSRAR